MSEYIITDKQLGLIEDFANVCVDGKKLQKIVRCRDCRYLCDDGSTWGCGYHCSCLAVNDGTPPDGFCSWGEREL